MHGIGGGLLVFVKQGLTILSCDKTSLFNQYCQFKLLSNNKVDTITFTLVYRSPNSSAVNNSDLNMVINSLDKNNIIIGDFNYPNIDWINNISDFKARPFLDTINDKFLEQLVTFPTHCKGNILDLVLSDIPDRVINLEPLGNLGNSDHSIISIDIIYNPSYNSTNEYIPNWFKADIPLFSDYLNSKNWPAEFQNFNTDQCWNYLKETISEGMKKFVPCKRRRQNNRPPWMSQKILKLVRKKQRRYNKYMQSKSPQDFTDYKELEKTTKTAIRNAKRNFEKKLSSEHNKRPFNSYLKSKTHARSTIGPLKLNGQLFNDNKNMATILNDYFGSVFTNPDGASIPIPDTQVFGSPISNISFTERDIIKKIMNLKPSSSAGPDKISSKFLQTFASEVSVPLTLIFDKSMVSGDVPADWKHANITPIFKKGAKSDPGNYRPISLTSIPCKLFESLIKDGITKHLEVNALISQSQHGFTKSKSCLTNLLEFLETVTSEFEKGNAFDVIYLDFAKAFDTVPHDKLLAKMKSYGIEGELFKWFKNWLTGRKQCVVLNGESSDLINVDSGVPQGSVLGPLAFLIYINDIDAAATLIKLIKKFADDTKLGQTIINDKDRADLQECLNLICNWASKWGMHFNVNKCKVMHIGKNNPKADYYMNGEKLADSEMERDIGIIISNNLKPSKQCSEAARKANAVLGMITKAFHYRDRHVYINLYKQYVRPHLEFCSPAWSPWTQADINCLEQIQQRAVRLVSGLRSQDYNDRLKELKLLSLKERRIKTDMITTYKILNGFDRVDPSTWFKQINQTRRTRLNADPANLEPTFTRTEIRKNFFSIRVPDVWNKLPAHVKSSTSIYMFKSRYDDYLCTRTVDAF